MRRRITADEWSALSGAEKCGLLCGWVALAVIKGLVMLGGAYIGIHSYFWWHQ